MKTLKENLFKRALLSTAILCLFVLTTQAQQTSGPRNISMLVPPPSANNQQGTTTAQPASSPTGTQTTPTGNQPQPQQPTAPPPGSNARPVTPAGQTEQSVQPQTQADQQQRGTESPAQTQPQTPQGGQPSTTQTPSQPAQPGTTIEPAQTPTAPGRESVPAPAPEELLNVPQVAPGFRANPSEPLPELGRVGVNMADQRPLTVREAIEMALANNRDIEIARENVRIAEFDLLGSRGAYDPRLSSLSYYERINTPSSSFLSGGANGVVTQADLTNTARMEGLSPKWGGGYRVDFSAIRLTTNNQFAALNPQYPTALTFNYTQPLWRGFRFDTARRAIEIAKKNLSLTDAQFRQRTIEIITQVQRAYWDLVFALRNLQIQQTAVRDARTQLEHNRRLVQQGMLAPIDVVSAEAQVSGFEQSMYSALEDVSRAENNLKNLISENRQSAIWNVSILPTDNVEVEPPAVDVTEAMDAALRNRPELQQANLAREINEIDQRYYGEQTKPQIDLVGSYGVVGLAGNQNSSSSNNPLTSSSERTRQKINEIIASLPNSGIQPLPPPVASSIPENLLGSYPQSLENLAANRYNNFRVGVQLNLPIRNRTAEAQYGRSLVEGQRIATQRQQLEQLIQLDVRNALQVVRTAESRLRAAAAARQASEEQYASEQRKFDAGQSTIFLVLERQTQLTTARGLELRAQTDLNKAIADLQRATGNALEANHVVVRVR